jgi:hypothetical protein
MQFQLIERDHGQRPAAERAIRDMFFREYGAEVAELPSLLIALQGDDGAILCASGLRFIEHGFFSESYLDQPVEQCLARHFNQPVARRQIVEFSNMASMQPGLAMRLVQQGVRHSLLRGARFGIFTATRRLRLLVRRSGYGILEMGTASPQRVANPSAWGTYYLHDPRVMAVPAAALPRTLAPTEPMPAGEYLHA